MPTVLPPWHWTEEDFQTLLKWESDGIFPRIYAGTNGPNWYEAEKRRRGITIHPVRIVPWEEFVQ